MHCSKQSLKVRDWLLVRVVGWGLFVVNMLCTTDHLLAALGDDFIEWVGPVR